MPNMTSPSYDSWVHSGAGKSMTSVGDVTIEKNGVSFQNVRVYNSNKLLNPGMLSSEEDFKDDGTATLSSWGSFESFSLASR